LKYIQGEREPPPTFEKDDKTCRKVAARIYSVGVKILFSEY
jgi:hypothetical protein